MANAAAQTDILIIDDDASLGEMLQMHIDDLGLTSDVAHSESQARETLANKTVRLILLDQHLPDTLGLTFLPWLKTHHPQTDVIMVTGFHEMELVIAAMQAGAVDYIHKPIDTDKLDQILKKRLKKKQAKLALHTAPPPEEPQDGEKATLIGNSAPMLEVGKQIAMAAQNNAPVLIRGASGTGKELVARAIHRHTHKSTQNHTQKHSHNTGAFVAINCASIVDTLLESELFGHEKGAFTGADSIKKGRFEVAAGGTLFLDEIGEMSPPLQSKLLRVLQEQTFERVGGTTSFKTDARIIAASHRNLAEMVKAGTFREDLLFRLDVISITLPTLAEREDDFDMLIAHILMRLNKKLSKSVEGLTADGLDALKQRRWHGNVRELENTLTRLVTHTTNTVLTGEDVQNILHHETNTHAPHPHTKDTHAPNTPQQHHQNTAEPPLVALEEVEKEHVLKVYNATGHHKGQTASILGISRPALDRRLKKWRG